MLILIIIGKIVLALLTTLAIVFVFLYLLSKSLDWLYNHYGATIRRLRRLPPEECSNDSGYSRADAEYRIYLHYLCHSARRILKWINNVALYIHIRSQNKNRANQCSKTMPKGLVPRRHLRNCTILSRWHIRDIVNRLRSGVNHSGKEPT